MNLYEYQRSRSFIDLHPRSLRFTFSNFFSLETSRPIEAKFHVERPWDTGMKVCLNGLCHMTAIYGHCGQDGPTPTYCKNLKKIFFSGNLESLYAASGTRVLQVCSNDDPELTLTYFTPRSNLIPYAFVWEKGK